MTVINIENYDKKSQEITKCLENAKFIGIDLEFSALYPVKSHSPSLFDNPNERYLKLRKNLAQVIPIQIGLTAFNFDADKNSYTGTVYNFYVQPASFPTIHRSFYFQSDTLNFLRLYGFDFNEFLYLGIPFINKEQEVELRQKLKNNEITENQSSCKCEILKVLEIEENGVKKWYNNAENGAKLTILKTYDKYKNNFEILYFLHKILRSRFNNIWTAIENDEFVIRKVTNEEYRILERDNNLNEEIISNLLGFTKIFRLLISLRKPIVGHNLLQDILLMIRNFETSLPHSYSDLKKIASNLFPLIFDTKTISYEMRNLVSEEKRWSDSGLETLFEYFKNGTGRHLALNSPTIILEGEKGYSKFHEAGWDSFCAGYIFIRLAYLNVYQKYPKSKSFVSSELIGGLSEWKNRVNVIRGSVSSIRIDGEDPNSTRPPFLVIESIQNRPVNLSQVSSILSSFGFVEVKKFPYQNKRVLIAVDNFGNARRILNKFKSHKEFQVMQYNVLKHSLVVRAFLLSGITISSTILLWLTHRVTMR